MPRSTVDTLKMRYAALRRFRAANDPEVIQTKKDLDEAVRWARSERHIQALLDQFPPLTAEEKADLTRMLAG